MKKILVIKQTSLGDVLHATGHLRAIKQAYPEARLYLMTATTSKSIYEHSPWVDEFILIDRYRVKREGPRRPLWAIRYMFSVLKQVRQHQFELAIDLQGLAKTVFFLYFSHAQRKIVKGRWWGLKGFRDKHLHAIREMDQVLSVAQIPPSDTSMEFSTTSEIDQSIVDRLAALNPDNRPVIILSAFSRWPSKDWPLGNYVALARALSNRALILFTGESSRKQEIDEQLGEHDHPGIINLAGALTLPEFAALCAHVHCMVTGDSFPMHVCNSKKTPVIALFGPTHETRVGPLGKRDRVIRAPDCHRCDRKDCSRRCLDKLDHPQVIEAVLSHLD